MPLSVIRYSATIQRLMSGNRTCLWLLQVMDFQQKCVVALAAVEIAFQQEEVCVEVSLCLEGVKRLHL